MDTVHEIWQMDSRKIKEAITTSLHRCFSGMYCTVEPKNVYSHETSLHGFMAKEGFDYGTGQ